MELTNSMVRAAIGKAVEAGLLTRNAAQNEHDWEIMRSILAAALKQNSAATETPVLLRGKNLESW